jgi:hypothetical protein
MKKGKAKHHCICTLLFRCLNSIYNLSNLFTKYRLVYSITMKSKLPQYPLRLAVFDLDYTIWQPEMYQLYGRPKLVPTPSNLSSNLVKETRTKHDGMILVDSKRTNTPMRVFPGA